MGYPINGITGTITSWTSIAGTEMVNQLIGTAIRPYEFTISAEGDPQDITGFNTSGTAKEYLSGLRSATFDFAGWYPKTAPNLGDTGVLTFASGYVQFCKSWFLELDFGEEDITNLPASGWKSFMPSGLLEWSGGWTARAVSDTAVNLPPAVNTAAAAATFKIKECGVADAQFSGTIVVGSMSQPVKVRGQQEVSYTFKGSGDLTNTPGTTGGPGILKATAGVITPAATEWDANGDGTADINVTMQSAASRTIVGPAILRRLRIEVDVDKPVKVTGTGRFSGAVTVS